MEEAKKEKEKKPFNVVLLGNIESEKAALLHKFIKKRFAIKQLKEMNMSDENSKEDSNIDKIMNSVEIHGETVRMKIWDNVSANKIFSSSNKSLKVAQGVILFYSVGDRKSFSMLKLSLSKIIDFDKYDIPMLMVGNDSDTPNREVTYEEAKALADSYGLRFYETSIKSGMANIFEDIGEQVFYQEYGIHTNSNKNKDNLNLSLSTSKSTKNINNKISICSNNDFYDNDFNNKLKKKESVSLFSLTRSKSNKNYNNNNKNKNNALFNSDMDFDDSKSSFKNNGNSDKENINDNGNSIINNNRKNKINNNKNKNKYDHLIKSPDIQMSSSNLINSSSLMFSYQGKTEAQKNREEEIREKRLKREKEMKSWWKIRERENLEKNKLKKQKEKEELQQKIKEDKINQKEKEKKASEENYTKMKNNYEQKKKSIKETEKEIILGKENKRMEKLLEKKSNKEKLNKLKEEKEKEIKIIYNNRNNNKSNNNKNNINNKTKKTLTYNKSESNITRNNNNVNKLRGKNSKNKKEKNQINESLNCSSIITLDEQENIKQNLEIKNQLLENYQNNYNVYRCLKCRLIPNIIINEYNQEIETYCDDSYKDISHHNITTYSKFQDLSLNHPIDNNNILCYYCNKAISELLINQTIYYCSLCDIYFCTEDEELHKNQKHKNNEDIKEQYLQLSKNRIKMNANKKNTILSTPSNSKKIKTLNKQKSTPFLLKNNHNKESNREKNKLNIKKSNKENKNTDSINNNLTNINNNSVILSDKTKEKKKNKNYNKVQIYLIDSYCNIHNEIFKSYCINCHKNICELCEDNHINHNIIKFEEILLEDEELIEKKNELNKIKEDLMKINDYFSALIAAIKCKFERLFNIKKKELEIKEKIIKDYETIKYNYHCINNIRNIKFDNNKTYIDKSNNTDWFHRFNLIFKYLNSDLNIKTNDIFDILNNRNEKNNIKIISNDIKEKNINKLIVLNNEDLAISTQNGNIIIYDKDNLKEKISIKISDKNLGINDFIEKEGGGLLCCGYEYINYIYLSLNNKVFDIKQKFDIYKKGININSIIELNNNLFVTSNDNEQIQLWRKSFKSGKFKCIDCYDCDLNDNKGKFNIIYKINNDSFIFNSFNNYNLSLFKINTYDKIELKKSIENIKITKGNNSIIKIPNEEYLFLSCYENDDSNEIINEKDNYDSIYNNLYSDYRENFSIKILDINNLNIIGKIQHNFLFTHIKYYTGNIIIALDLKGIIHKIEFDKYQHNLFSLDEFNFNNNFKYKIDGINISKNSKSLILLLNNKIIKLSNFD